MKFLDEVAISSTLGHDKQSFTSDDSGSFV